MQQLYKGKLAQKCFTLQVETMISKVEGRNKQLIFIVGTKNRSWCNDVWFPPLRAVVKAKPLLRGQLSILTAI